MTDHKDERQAESEEKNSLLGPRQTPEEIQAEKNRLKRQRKEERRQERRQARSLSWWRRPLVWLAIGRGALLTAGIVVFVLVGTHTGLFGGGKEMAPGSGFFSRPDDEPEMSEEGIKGVIREAYFTKDKHMAVLLLLSNGLPTRHYLTSLEVKIRNEEGQTVASGYAETIPDDFLLEPNSTAYFLFYISPEYVLLPEDDLDSLTYEINTKGRLEDESVLTTRATAAN